MNKQYLAYQQQLISSFDEQGIAAQDINFLAEGADHYVYNFNFHEKKMVARVPKNISVIEQVKTEAEILQDFITTNAIYSKGKVPSLIFINSRKPFTVSQCFSGRTLDKANLEITPQNSAILDDFSTILAEFHQYNGSKKHLLNNVCLDTPLNLLHQSASIFQEDELKTIQEAIVIGYSKSKTTNIPVTLHYDIGPSNIMVSDDNSKLTGVIDFTGCKLGDYHFDIARARQMFGNEESWNIFKHKYENKAGLKINTDKALFYGIWNNLDILVKKIKNNDILPRINGAKHRTLELCKKLQARNVNNKYFINIPVKTK